MSASTSSLTIHRHSSSYSSSSSASTSASASSSSRSCSASTTASPASKNRRPHTRRSASYAHPHQPRARNMPAAGGLPPLPRPRNTTTTTTTTPAMPIPSPSHGPLQQPRHHQTPSHRDRPNLPPSRSMTLYPRYSTSHSHSHSHSHPSPRQVRPSARVMSPSRLPPTDTLSYFPPFESMGSGPDLSSTENEKGGGGARRHEVTPPGSPDPNGRKQHSKGRSLGSIAGFVNSFGLFSRKSTIHVDQEQALSPHVSSKATSDENAVQALSRRVTPGKRKVLETISVANQDIKLATRKVSDGKTADGEGGVSKAPIRSPPHDDPHSSKRPSLHLPIPEPSWRVPLPSPPVASISPLIPAELFAFFVDNPVTATSTATPTIATSPSRKSVSLSNSPSEAHLPDLPQNHPVGSRRSSTSSTKSMRSFAGDKEIISPVSSFSTLLDSASDGGEPSGSEPCTPEKSWVQGTIIPPTLAFSDSLKTFSSQIDATASVRMDPPSEHDDDEYGDGQIGSPSRGSITYLGLGHRLKRRPRAGSSASARSADSNRTIRPGTYAQEDVTPKAGRGWRAVRDEEDGIVHFKAPEGSPGLSIADDDNVHQE